MKTEFLKKINPTSIREYLHIRHEKLIYTFPFLFTNPFKYIKWQKVFNLREKNGLASIPIFLISFNRLTYLKTMIARLEAMGKTNIIIIDNASTYPPLLDYYEEIPYKIIRLKKNYGHMVFWECPALKPYRQDFYIVSDPDVIPLEECPSDFIEKLFYVLKRHPNIRKVGLSLKIDDLPQNNVFGRSVIDWEQKFYWYFVKRFNAYIAITDTTFALYPPDCLVDENISFLKAMRLAYPYQARHLPWYKTSDLVTDEDRFYSENNITGWWTVGKAAPSDKEAF